MRGLGLQARAAARALARADTAAKNRALTAMAAAIRHDSAKLLKANADDIKAARASGKDDAFVDRLTLSAKSVETMAQGLEQVARGQGLGAEDVGQAARLVVHRVALVATVDAADADFDFRFHDFRASSPWVSGLIARSPVLDVGQGEVDVNQGKEPRTPPGRHRTARGPRPRGLQEGAGG